VLLVGDRQLDGARSRARPGGRVWPSDYVLANPPFNDSDWRGELLKDDQR
jgi:N-6 DNA Methylase.